KLYTMDTLFSLQQTPTKAIQAEKQRIKNEDAAFLALLPKDSYVSWFLPARKLVSSVSLVAQYRPEEIPTSFAVFRDMDYADHRLYKSGLFKDAIEGHFWLIENSGLPLDSVIIEMKNSIDAIMVHLSKDNKKFNEVMDYLFNLLEQHSHFKASEYLALKVLNETSCTIDSDLARQLESYRTMKIGNIAPDMVFSGDFDAPGYASNLPKNLANIKGNYIVVVFGASWCPKCKEELPEIAKLYSKWKELGAEVVFVSLDDDKKMFQTFVKDFPFISTCDYKKWEGNIVQDYLVFATPTMFLLDKNRMIVMRPNSVKQMDAWVDWVLVQGNK
ncbi:MAG TPA: TlpA disulfide reductase family protein, partial [Saprospiraceae bacterium]|nr:TlpA disulfide reductase family protein [Saprospiraceae bacterium]